MICQTTFKCCQYTGFLPIFSKSIETSIMQKYHFPEFKYIVNDLSVFVSPYSVATTTIVGSN